MGSLFSGIGGFDIGLKRAGFEVAWQCEIDPYCRSVLERHWPEVPNLGDVRNLCHEAPQHQEQSGGQVLCAG